MPDAIGGAKLVRQILVVDDEIDLARGLVALLKRRGLIAQAVGGPEEALDLVRAEPLSWGVVLTDMTMPSMSGREFRRHLRAIHPDLPVLLMSGMEDAMEPGEFEGSLVKPFKVDDLIPLLRPYLG
jgi:DNA-binding NtrC family response regulator